MVKENNRDDGDVKLFPKIIGIASLLKMNHRHRIALKIDLRRGVSGPMCQSKVPCVRQEQCQITEMTFPIWRQKSGDMKHMT